MKTFNVLNVMPNMFKVNNNDNKSIKVESIVKQEILETCIILEMVWLVGI